jgi:hypothetical protein
MFWTNGLALVSERAIRRISVAATIEQDRFSLAGAINVSLFWADCRAGLEPR